MTVTYESSSQWGSKWHVALQI